MLLVGVAVRQQVHHTTGAEFGSFDDWLAQEVCRVHGQESLLARAAAERSSQFVRFLALSRVFRGYVSAFRTIQSADAKSGKVKTARSVLEHLETRLAFDWQPDSDTRVFKMFRKFTCVRACM